MANLQEYYIGEEVDLDFIDTLYINSSLATCETDESFGVFRNRALYELI